MAMAMAGVRRIRQKKLVREVKKATKEEEAALSSTEKTVGRIEKDSRGAVREAAAAAHAASKGEGRGV